MPSDFGVLGRTTRLSDVDLPPIVLVRPALDQIERFKGLLTSSGHAIEANRKNPPASSLYQAYALQARGLGAVIPASTAASLLKHVNSRSSRRRVLLQTLALNTLPRDSIGVRRIASPGMLLSVDLLPHLKCGPGRGLARRRRTTERRKPCALPIAKRYVTQKVTATAAAD